MLKESKKDETKEEVEEKEACIHETQPKQEIKPKLRKVESLSLDGDYSFSLHTKMVHLR